jgi:hypothetical protein
MTDNWKRLIPQGRPITFAYLRALYERAERAREARPDDVIINLGGRDVTRAELESVGRDLLSDGMKARMRRDATIAVLKAKCGVR